MILNNRNNNKYNIKKNIKQIIVFSYFKTHLDDLKFNNKLNHYNYLIKVQKKVIFNSPLYNQLIQKEINNHQNINNNIRKHLTFKKIILINIWKQFKTINK